ncbi:MAG: hypothetical protein HRF50_12295 [Phycisphaerae bacterium]|jgi:hypothetical protein
MRSASTSEPTEIEHALSIEMRIGSVGQRLADAFRALVDAMPGGPYRPQELARALGIKKDLSSRVLRASRNKDPVAVVHMMPGPVPLRQLLQAAAEKSIAPEILREGEEAVRQFDLLIRQEAGDRTSLDAIISTCLPDAREKFELFNKQAVYRGMAQLKGVSAEVTLNTALLHPGTDPGRIDGVWIIGSFGLRRIRPSAVVHFCSHRLGPTATTLSTLTLDGEPVQDLHGLLLDAYCSSPRPPLQARRHGATVHYTLDGEAIGPHSAVNLVFAELTPGCLPRYRDAEDRLYGPGSEITTPTSTLIFDVLIHEDVYPGREPALRVYDTAVNGLADMNDPARDIDRLDVAETIQPLGRGPSKWRVSEVPRYVELVRHVFAKVNWDAERFRGYRCKVQYPIYGSQLSLAFHAPERP